MNAHRYDNQVAPDNAYGHALTLLDRHLGSAEGRVHLDLACGLGAIAPHVEQTHGVHYVGVDVDAPSVEAVRARGFEAHVGDLGEAGVAVFLESVLDGRSLASVSLLDGLEHLTDGSHLLRALAGLLTEHRAIAVLSVPNVTHRDVGIKTLLGRWDYTPTGLLDETHYHLFSATSLEATLAEVGLVKLDEHDVVLPDSDQHFPVDHGALDHRTPVSQFLAGLRDGVDRHGSTNQFVWAVEPGEVAVPSSLPDGPEPFLSVLLRTQGRRPQDLREALLCLAAQSDSDFEVLLIAHRATDAAHEVIEGVVADQPEQLRARIRMLRLDTGGRTAPLNVGLRQARGRYLVVFDDDDLLLGDWVRAFHEGENSADGGILRSQCVVHEVDYASVRGLTAIKGRSSPTAPYAPTFSLAQHLVLNQSPAHSWAFPRTLHRDFGLVYDESLSTTEDWDFLLRGAQLVGVRDVPKVSAIYHWWTQAESSRTAHDRDEWQANHALVEQRMAERPMLLPPVEGERLRQMVSAMELLNCYVDAYPLLARELRLTHQHASNLEAILEAERAQAKRAARQAARDQTKLRRRLRRKRKQVGELRGELEAGGTTSGSPVGKAKAAVRRVLGS